MRKFDIVRATELKIRLYASGSDSYLKRSQDILLGRTKLIMFFSEIENSRRTDWLTLENGTGKLLVESYYTPNTTRQIETWKWNNYIEGCRYGSIYKVKKSSTERFYAAVQIRKADILSY